RAMCRHIVDNDRLQAAVMGNPALDEGVLLAIRGQGARQGVDPWHHAQDIETQAECGVMQQLQRRLYTGTALEFGYKGPAKLHSAVSPLLKDNLPILVLQHYRSDPRECTAAHAIAGR